ncbi:MAG TPA: hypothetical protein VMJ10_10250 [Kofleriaceae bacterium]|nr:hypothetical protein [Kofleriaceae bacterium]
MAVMFATACATAPTDGGSPTGDPGKADGDGCMPGAPGTLDSCLGFMSGPPVSQGNVASIVQTDDKIVVYGTAIDASAPGYHAIVVRYLATGAPDPAFQPQLPAAQGSYYFHAMAAAEAQDQSLLLTGTMGEDEFNQHTAYVLQLGADGAAVPGGLGGTLPVPNDNFSAGTKIVVAPGGDFYVAGTGECSITFTCDTKDMFVAHFDAGGHLDTSYGTNGFAQLRAGQHTTLTDAVVTDAGLDLLGTESEPIWVQGQQSSFDTVVVGALDPTGMPRAGFGTAGVFTWYDSSTGFGSIGKAFHVAADGTITVDGAITSDTLLVIGTNGQLQSATPYYSSISPTIDPHFAADGSIFATVNDFPSVRFAHFSATGTLDSAFQSNDIQIPSLPPGSDILEGAPVIETSDAWLVTTSIYLASSNPDTEFVLFKVWK